MAPRRTIPTKSLDFVLQHLNLKDLAFDSYGVSPQNVRRILGEMITDPDRAKARRVSEAIMKMVKLDITQWEAAYAQ